MKSKKPLVSVAIPTLNSAKTLEKTLKSIKDQTYKNTEIIVADGNSIDDTRKIAREYKAKICDGKELAKARYNALKISKGKYIFALDSDQFIGKTVIERAVETIQEGNYDALILRERSIVRRGTFIEKLLALDKEVIAETRDVDPTFGAEIPRFFNREKLLSLKWPKKVSILDDAILYSQNLSKIGRIGRLEGSGISHNEVQSFRVFFKKFMRYGKLYAETLAVSKSTTLAHSLPRRSYFTWSVLKTPDRLVSLLLLYFLKSVAVLSGMILYQINKIK